MDARKNLNDNLEAALKQESQPVKKEEPKKAAAKDNKKPAANKFKRVMIEESSDEEVEPQIEEVGGTETKDGESSWWKKKRAIDSKFPLAT